MTFLNPLVLFGLIAAAVPVLLHLLNLRKLRTIEFSTLTFLKELQQTKIRKLKLRQLLLLIVRTLLIAFIILAFARPALRGTFLGGIGTQTHSTIVIIFDDGFAMQANDEQGERLKQAKTAAEQILDIVKNGDELYLLKLSDLPRVTINPAAHDPNVLRTVLRETQFSEIHHTLQEAFTACLGLLRHSVNVNKEIYVVGTLQKTLFALSQNRQTGDSLLDQHAKIFLCPIGSKTIENVAVDSVDVKTVILEKDKPATVYASFRNFGSTTLNNYVASIYLDGVKAAQGNISTEPFGSASLRFSVIPKRSGFLSGYVELETDAIETDNRRYFTMYIPDQINTTIVGTDDAANKFLSLALHAGSGTGDHSLLTLQQFPEEKLPQIDLNHVDVLVCTNIRSMSSNDAGRIRSFLENGGGLILFPGNGMDLRNYNTSFLPLLDIPPIEGMMSAQGNGISFQNIDLDHPLFATIFEQERTTNKSNQHTIESPAIRQAVHRQTGKHGQTVIGMSNGDPFLSEHTLGNGKILVYSVSPTLSWSDFPVKGIFAPLMYRSIIYVSPKEHRQSSYMTGMQPVLTIPHTTGTAEKQFTMKAPDGNEEIVRPSIASAHGSEFTAALTCTSPLLKTSGIYGVKNGTTTISEFAVNIDPQESDTRLAKSDEMEPLWKHFGIESGRIEQITKGEQIQSTVLQSRFGTELWRYCIGIALLLALLEMAIARDSRKALQQI